jgi:serine/threonine-protein phosphatase 2B catalytic subunit
MTVGQSQLERAIYEIQHRANVPQLDFTQHQLENGYTISTQERVVKEVRFADLPTRMLLHVWDRCKHP